MQLTDDLWSLIDRVNLRAYLMLLDTPRVLATIPMIRGVWGRALRQIDERTYERFFVGERMEHFRLPRYILRPAPANPATAPAVEWIILGEEDKSSDPLLFRAWEVATGMGLGPDRIPFRVREIQPISPNLTMGVARMTKAWPLSLATCPIDGFSGNTPCHLSFDVPLRLMRRRNLLLEPSLSDIVVAALRRISLLAGFAAGASYRDLVRTVRASASWQPATSWKGERRDLTRWSGSQRREIDLFGVIGGFDLPEGPGPAWPLLAASCWTHVGKGTVFGLGQPKIRSLT